MIENGIISIGPEKYIKVNKTVNDLENLILSREKY
jgi:hypothetical protein